MKTPTSRLQRPVTVAVLLAAVSALVFLGWVSTPRIVEWWAIQRFEWADDATKWSLAHQLVEAGPRARRAAVSWYVSKAGSENLQSATRALVALLNLGDDNNLRAAAGAIPDSRRRELVSSLIVQAADHVRADEYGNAAATCEVILAIDPNHKVATFWLQECQDRANGLRTGASTFSRLSTRMST